MRDWLNTILAFIGMTSLTDVEWDAMNLVGMVTLTYNQAAYDQLSAVLLSREDVSTMQGRLAGLFKAKGLDVAVADTAKTNIFIGAVLE